MFRRLYRWTYRFDAAMSYRNSRSDSHLVLLMLIAMGGIIAGINEVTVLFWILMSLVFAILLSDIQRERIGIKVGTRYVVVNSRFGWRRFRLGDVDRIDAGRAKADLEVVLSSGVRVGAAGSLHLVCSHDGRLWVRDAERFEEVAGHLNRHLERWQANPAEAVSTAFDGEGHGLGGSIRLVSWIGMAPGDSWSRAIPGVMTIVAAMVLAVVTAAVGGSSAFASFAPVFLGTTAVAVNRASAARREAAVERRSIAEYQSKMKQWDQEF